MPSRLTTKHKTGILLIYPLILGAAVCFFLLVSHLGESLHPRPEVAGPATQTLTSQQNVNLLMHVLLALTAIVLTTRSMGAVFAWINQPPVIGEIIGGILLGPSVLGWIAPAAYAYLLPRTVPTILSVVAQVGIILYMFLVGLELDTKLIRRSGHATLAISHASIVAPFVLGSAFSLWLYPILGTGDASFKVFALFIGVSMSVTAFPVLARILTDRGISRTRMGALALTCAAIDDATAWCLLAFVVSVAQARVSGGVWTLLLTVAFIFCVFLFVLPLMQWLVPRLERSPQLSRNGIAIVFVAMLLSSLATELIGIHAIFGAFLLGAVIPFDSRISHELTHRLTDVIGVLFLPIFFAFTGMRTQIGLIGNLHDWLVCGAIILVACIGKFGGAFSASRLTGLNWRDSTALGILMNTRGLVELIVLNIGLDLKVISPTLFTMLVIMALVTTLMTTPVLHVLLRNHPWEEPKSVRHSVSSATA